MDSSSSAIGNCHQYDVFLSFRGTDTRHNFTSHLYRTLCQAQVKAFIDNNLDKGEEITPALERVIECAKISIIVFSSDYASSTFSLDELVKIMECKESKAQTVLPVFYKVYPSQATYQEAFARHKEGIKMKVKRWKSSFWKTLNFASDWKAFERHEEETIKQEMKVKIWKSAFCKALNLAGWHIDDNSDEAEIIGDITGEVLKKLNYEPRSQSLGEELICKSLIGQTSKANLEKVWECLMDEKISRVGVCGMGGVGKTTIVTHVNNRAANSFSNIYWVTVSKDWSIHKLQHDIAKVVNLDLSEEDDERKRAAKLWKKLDRCRKFVLILDDVWEAFETEDVGIPLLVGGGKLLLTTRKLQVCKRMYCLSIKVEPLSKEEAWDLFIEESKCQINDSLQYRGIVECIVRECAGLPLAIVVVARSMRGVVEISIWRNILRELEKPCQGQNNDMDEGVFRPLKVSHDRLPNDKCRRCLLYCSFFPEDYVIEINDLVNYWIADGLIDEEDSSQEELDKGTVIINELISASLLEQVQHWRKAVKMHDVIRDMTLIIRRENFEVQVGLHLQDLLKETEWLIIPRSVALRSNTALKMFSSKLEQSCSNLENCLPDAPNLYLSENLRRSPSLNNLKDLQVLGLSKLSVLDLSFSNVEEIGKIMERITNLRVQNLSGNQPLNERAVLEKLSCLELEDRDVEVEPDELISLQNLATLSVNFYNLESLNSYLKSGHWQRLRRYRIFLKQRRSSPRIKMIPFCKKASSEQTSHFGAKKGEINISFPNDIEHLEMLNWDCPMDDVLRNKIFPNLHIVEIIGYKGSYIFSPALAQRLLRIVKILIISFGGNKLEEIIATKEESVNQSNCSNYPTIVLPQLKFLMLERLPALRSIYRGSMVCPSIDSIIIHGCRKLERLPFCVLERNENPREKLPRIKLHATGVSPEWWDSLQWDNPNAKSIYQCSIYS